MKSENLPQNRTDHSSSAAERCLSSMHRDAYHGENESYPEAPLLNGGSAGAAALDSNAFRIHARDCRQLNEDMCKMVHAEDRNQMPTNKMRE